MSVEEFRVQISHVAWLLPNLFDPPALGFDVTTRYALHSTYLHATVATASIRAMGNIGLFDNNERDHQTLYPLIDAVPATHPRTISVLLLLLTPSRIPITRLAHPPYLVPFRHSVSLCCQTQSNYHESRIAQCEGAKQLCHDQDSETTS